LRTRLATKFIVTTCLLVVMIVATCGWLASWAFNREISSRAQTEATLHADRVIESLGMINSISSDNLGSATRLMEESAGKLGEVSLGKTVQVKAENVPDLRFGTASQVENFALVDHVKSITGATATLFVRRGDDFIRVSTNVMKPDGTRAVGTALDPKGPAAAAIRNHRAYYGIADILGTSYVTAYKPMQDRSGNTIGIWYAGVPVATLADLGKSIQQSVILKHGYVALLDAKKRPVFTSSSTSAEKVARYLEKPEPGWNQVTRTFNAWGYSVIALYPESDLKAQINLVRLSVFLTSLIVVMLMAGAEYLLVRKFISAPLMEITSAAQRIACGDVEQDVLHHSEDEIGSLAKSFREVIAYNRSIATACEALGRGDLTVSVEPRTEQDLLARNFTHAAASLRETIQQMAGSSTSMASASEELSATASQLSSNAEETATQALAVSEAAGEISRNVQTVVSGSEQMIVSIKEISTNAHRAAKVAADGVKIAQEANESVGKLNISSNEIGNVVKVITTIAEQTHLLALNATIEAARAGEAGKGFAVVAKEVKELARETAKATEDIRRKILAIQSDTAGAIHGIGEIGTIISEIHDIQTTIASAVEEQTATTNEISRNIADVAKRNHEVARNVTGVSEATKGTTEGAEYTNKAAGELAALAATLKSLVSQFEFEEDVEPGADAGNDGEHVLNSQKLANSKAHFRGSFMRTESGSPRAQ
jgi:methyl-accepting chemotaxis protein